MKLTFWFNLINVSYSWKNKTSYVPFVQQNDCFWNCNFIISKSIDILVLVFSILFGISKVLKYWQINTFFGSIEYLYWNTFEMYWLKVWWKDILHFCYISPLHWTIICLSFFNWFTSWETIPWANVSYVFQRSFVTIITKKGCLQVWLEGN